MSDNKPHTEPEMQGWLFKWTNYVKRYQKRWFVLSNGVLSYYRSQAEMAHTCRGTISLQGALIHTQDSCTFVISNGGTQQFHIKALNEVERQTWVTALELAKAKAIRELESEEDDMNRANKFDPNQFLKEMSSRLEDLQTCSELITKHGSALQRALSELESVEHSPDMAVKMKAINERATLFRITSNAMINTSTEYLNVVQSQSKNLQKMIEFERNQRIRLEEIVEQLARQENSLFEKAVKDHNLTKPSSLQSDDEDGIFYDAQEQNAEENFTVKVKMPNLQRRSSSHNNPSDTLDTPGEASGSSSETEEAPESNEKQVVVISSGNSLHQSNHVDEKPQKDRMTSNPSRRTKVPDKPNYPLNLWSIMKNCIGKELTKIPMPVNFSEPLSMLQRLTEDYEYSDILDLAAELTDSCEQLAYVAAFTVSSYATTSNRTGKPFNPLLGETYECDRTDDLGWKAISEQVSHHPPMVAQYCEGKKWKCWQEFTMGSKFRGKYLQVIPLGTAHLEFDNKNHYTWRKVTTTVHNIIVGKLWVDQHGDMDIINHTDGSKCLLSYIPYSYFNRDSQRKVKGCVMDRDGNMKWVIRGTWDEKIEIAPVLSTSEGSKDKDQPVSVGNYVVAWKRRPTPPDSDKFYNFTLLACQLNEPEDGVAPTDSRNRPDQRLMEEGKWDEANAKKIALEEKQRAVRRQRESSAEKASTTGNPYQPYEPVWFTKETDPITGNVIHVYKGGYWECKEKRDWSVCPNIF